MKKDDAELYFNAAIYYAFGTYGLQLNGVYSAVNLPTARKGTEAC